MVHNDTRFVGHPGSDWEQATTQLMAGKLAYAAFDVVQILTVLTVLQYRSSHTYIRR